MRFQCWRDGVGVSCAGFLIVWMVMCVERGAATCKSLGEEEGTHCSRLCFVFRRQVQSVVVRGVGAEKHCSTVLRRNLVISIISMCLFFANLSRLTSFHSSRSRATCLVCCKAACAKDGVCMDLHAYRHSIRVDGTAMLLTRQPPKHIRSTRPKGWVRSVVVRPLLASLCHCCSENMV